jgi:hypothetical protein
MAGLLALTVASSAALAESKFLSLAENVVYTENVSSIGYNIIMS